MKKILLLALLLTGGIAQAEEQNYVPFNGLITDLTGAPVKGAKIFIVDKSYATKSDRKGRFGLSDVKSTDTLHVIYNRTRYDIPVAGRRSVRIRLGDQYQPTPNLPGFEVDEDQAIVDLGYGYVRRREQVTASSGISGEVLRRTGKTNVLDALVGLVPGLNIRSSNIPGQSASVNMRGISSITLSNEPLYLVDGVEVSNLDFVSLFDVESVEVMKDGSIYGARGANGAINVHTKK